MTIVLIAVFLILQALDLALTVKILRGGGTELNPFLPSSPVAHIAVKVPLVGAFAAIASFWPLCLASVLTACAVRWNLRQLRRASA